MRRSGSPDKTVEKVDMTAKVISRSEESHEMQVDPQSSVPA